jgi:hypothetical protein
MGVPYYPQGTITPNLGLSLNGMDEVLADDMIIIDAFAGTAQSIQVNGAVIPQTNFIDSATVTFTVAGNNVSANAVGGGGGGSVDVNGVPIAAPNFNNLAPAAPLGGTNVLWQVLGGSVSAYVVIPAAGTFPVTIAAVASKWLNSYSSVTGLFTATQPLYSDISGTPQLAQTNAGSASHFLSAYDAATGLFSTAQPTFSDLSSHPTTLSGYGITDAIAAGLMTTLGDMIYENATPTPTRLAGNITTTKKYLSQTGTGAVSAAPVWAQINYADITGTAPVTAWSSLTGTLSNGQVIPYGDSGISRLGAASLAIGNGTAGDVSGTISAAHSIFGNNTADGTSLMVSDSNRSLGGTAQSTLFKVLASGSTYENLAQFDGSNPAAREGFILSNSGSASPNWVNNFLQFLLAGKSHTGNNYITTYGGKSNDAGWSFVMSQGTDGNGMCIGTFSGKDLVLATNNAPRMWITGAGSTVIAGIGSFLPGTPAIQLNSGLPLQWNADAGISRLGAASLAIGNGTASDTTGNLSLNRISKAGADFAGQATVTAGQTTKAVSFGANYAGTGKPVIVLTPTSDPLALGVPVGYWVTYSGGAGAWTGFTVNIQTALAGDVVFNYIVIGVA